MEVSPNGTSQAVYERSGSKEGVAMSVDSSHAAIPLSSCEFLTVEQLGQRLHISRATVFAWMQRGIIVQGRHYFKRGHVLRFIWSDDLIRQLLVDSNEDAGESPTVKPDVEPLQHIKSNLINWDY